MEQMIPLQVGSQKMNLLKCLTCNQILTSEEAKSHTSYCNIKSTNWITVNAESIFHHTNDEGEKCVMVKLFDGTDYTFIEKRPNLVPFEFDQPICKIKKSTERKQVQESTDDGDSA